MPIFLDNVSFVFRKQLVTACAPLAVSFLTVSPPSLHESPPAGSRQIKEDPRIGPFLQQWKTREKNRDRSENLPDSQKDSKIDRKTQTHHPGEGGRNLQYFGGFRSWLRNSRFRTHGPLGCGLQYFYKRLTDGAGRVGDAQDRGERGSDVYGGDFTEHSLRRHSRAEKDDRHELVVSPGRAVSGGDR